ncbi:uncharacterized protein FIBRA_03823 [Fibroporia radiculosa]|uniref:Glucose-methanol-choline oxidoreductase N-terminal domain-containing protein n=1 Tax=Fibroporia radiculosa TaxID=599839 RepID=J4HW72_9APHY|nr:uncharacterized protein FIBRA_03823 [Fibroporia radiculosa]CCM01757.1 predicted protein [Fibroporia radiculosa]
MLVSLEQVANKFFDYVICGGGTAGLTLAVRLSEDTDKSVLVLEAGGSHIDDMSILRPASWGTHFGNDTQCWAYKTLDQYNRGKGLGGSSGINFMCWTKPPADEIDDIERLGNPGWNWANQEKYLSRTEGFIPPSVDVQKQNNMHLDTWRIGKTGPLKVAYPGTIPEGERKVQQTLLNAGLPVANCPLNGDPTGVFFSPCTYDPNTHTRSYATTAHYLPCRERDNLFILIGASANRVLTETTDNGKETVIAVEFEYSDQTCAVNVRKEAILSAGSLQSPHLLELSGIGQKGVLAKIGVPQKVDLPGVGENVQEHYHVGVAYELRDDVDFDTVDQLRDPSVLAKHLQLHASGTGLFTMGIIGFAFVPLYMISDKADAIYKTIEEKITTNKDMYPPGLYEQYKVQLERLRKGAPGCEFITFPGYMSATKPPVEGKRYVSIISAMNHCFSRGVIHSASVDPRKDPEMDPRYFEESVDLDIFCEMAKFARGLAQVSPLKDMIAHELNPGSEIQNEAQIRDWVKNSFMSTWHTASSCSMLPRENGGVVDPSLKVYGTNNLRVVDLSVLPLHFASHPQSTVYAIAEQAADIIKGKFNSSDAGAVD